MSLGVFLSLRSGAVGTLPIRVPCYHIENIPRSISFVHWWARWPGASHTQHTMAGVTRFTARTSAFFGKKREGNGLRGLGGYHVSACHIRFHSSSREHVMRPCSSSRNCTSALISGRIPSQACQYSAVSPSGWIVASSSTLRIYSSAVPVCFNVFQSRIAFWCTLRGMKRRSKASHNAFEGHQLLPPWLASYALPPLLSFPCQVLSCLEDLGSPLRNLY